MRKNTKTHTWSFGAGAVHETKHVPTGLGHGGHLGKHWEVVDDKWHLAPLLPCQRLSVAEDAKPCDVGGCVSVEGVHETSRYKQAQRERELEGQLDD